MWAPDLVLQDNQKFPGSWVCELHLFSLGQSMGVTVRLTDWGVTFQFHSRIPDRTEFQSS